MGLRNWTSRAINEGSTPIFAIGILIKIIVELGIAAAIAWGLTELVYQQISAEVLESYFGAASRDLIWLVLTGGVGWAVTRCRYDSADSPGDRIAEIVRSLSGDSEGETVGEGDEPHDS